MSAERNEVERSANTALAAEILREVGVATGLVRASLRCASFALIAGGTPAFPGKSGALAPSFFSGFAKTVRD